MPINVPKLLPVREILEKENIFVMEDERAIHQDIRPLNILILNLMPEKEKTELHLLRLLGNSPLQLNISFLHTATYESRNVNPSHLRQFYTTFPKVSNRRFDGMIITGAPIETMPFEKVGYWDELTEIMEWSKTHVTSALHICWGAQAALYYHYGIHKFLLDGKIFGIFEQNLLKPEVKLVRGFDDVFAAPHSRYTDVSEREILENGELLLLASSKESGPFLMMSRDEKQIMVTGHLEYDTNTLAEEYKRDLNRKIDVSAPLNYFSNGSQTANPLNRWRSHAHLLFSNWLNYYVYQETPFEWD